MVTLFTFIAFHYCYCYKYYFKGGKNHGRKRKSFKKD